MNKSIKTFQDLSSHLDEIVVSADIHKSYDLGRIKKALQKLDNPQDKFRVVHVAGTSGKTSTSYYIAEILRRGSYKVGLSVSPHIDEVNERVQVNLQPLNEAEFCENISEFLSLIEQNKIKLTYFELFVGFAFWYFAKIKIDIAVFEVGLGGLLDGTNVVNRPDKVCVITDIGLDHTHILGDSIREIAAQKAGIIQAGNIVFCTEQSAEILQIVKDISLDRNAELTVVSPEDKSLTLPYLKQRNWLLARSVCEYIFEGDSRDFLSKVEQEKTSAVLIPGRIEKFLVQGKVVILDGAHNAQKMSGLIKSLEAELLAGKATVVLSVGKNKADQLLEMSQAIDKIADKIIITSFDQRQDFEQKSLAPEYLAEYFPDSDVEAEPSLSSAIDKALADDSKIVIVTGSLYLVGRARAMIAKHLD